jgi:hypothetical protein
VARFVDKLNDDPEPGRTPERERAMAIFEGPNRNRNIIIAVVVVVVIGVIIYFYGGR